MSTIQAFAAAGMLVALAMLNSACTTGRNTNRADYQYNPRTSVNPACDAGFRPTNNWTCSY